jgi:hypothetical protein
MPGRSFRAAPIRFLPAAYSRPGDLPDLPDLMAPGHWQNLRGAL